MSGNDAPLNEQSYARSTIESGIRTGLETIGESAATATLYLIQTKFGLTLRDAPDHPDDFCRAMRGIFGLGSTVLVRTIRDILRMVPIASEEERKYMVAFTTSLEEYVRSAETNFA